MHDEWGAPDEFELALATLVIGKTLLVGRLARTHALAMAVAAGEIVIMADVAYVDGLAAEIEGQGLATVRRSPPAGLSKQVAGEGLATLVVTEYPDVPEPLIVFESSIAATSDGASIIFDLPAGGIEARRVRRLLEATCRDVEEPRWKRPDRLALVGVRDAPGHESSAQDVPEPVDLAFLVPVIDGVPNLPDLCVDALLRQNVPAAVCLFLDDAPEGKTRVPDDLWGMAAMSVTQPAILRTGGIGRSAALDLGVQHLDTAAVSIVDERARLVPSYVSAIATAMERRPKWKSVATDALVVDATGSSLGHVPPPLSSSGASCIAFRRHALVKSGGFSTPAGGFPELELHLGFLARRQAGRLPYALAIVPSQLVVPVSPFEAR